MLLGVSVLLAACGSSNPAWSFTPTGSAPRGATSASASSLAPASPVASPSGSPAPSVSALGLARFDQEGLAFDYPASWAWMPSGLNMHYITILGFVGTGTASAACEQITPGPSDSFISGSRCGADVKLQPGQVVVQVRRQDGPPHDPIDPSDPRLLEAGGHFVTVAGLPAIASTSVGSLPNPYNAELTLSWQLSMPGELWGSYSIEANLRGPGLDALQMQVEALVASVAYDPPVPVLDPANAATALSKGLREQRSNDPSFACFPTTPGASAGATVKALPGYGTLGKPLEVTCSSAIAPDPLGLWKVTLTEAWAKTAAHKAGQIQPILWLSADGSVVMSGAGPQPSSIPSSG
jgi:hypothetical protein